MTHWRSTLLAILLGLAAWSAAAAPASLSESQARHLLLRTGFAPTQQQVDRLKGQSAAAAVDGLIQAARASQPLYPAPTFTPMPVPVRGDAVDSAARQALRREQLRQGQDIKAWWMREMIESPSPLAERMTLFWHGHFATSQQKVVRAQLMWQQHQVIRAQALGNFATLLHNVAKDPAMLIYLDGANSRKEAPNENFAREVMELFVLGEASQGGGYSELDVKEAARAFTGWSIDREDFSYRFRPFFHDRGSKTVLGRSGFFDGDQVLDILLAQPAAARFITTKLWREFVSPVPEPAELERISRAFRSSGYDIGVALRGLLLSDAFWSADNPGSLIKSPVELIVGTIRQFGFSYGSTMPFVVRSAQLGQNLLAPPNVKGWAGYTDWINTRTLLERKRTTEQFFKAVSRRDGPADEVDSMAPGMAQREGRRSGPMLQGLLAIRFDPRSWLAQYQAPLDFEPSEAVRQRLAEVLLPIPAVQTVASGTVGLDYLRMLTLDPAYQLK